MDTESELNEVCEKLDQTLDGIMMTLEDILTCQAELDEYIKKGFLMMSKVCHIVKYLFFIYRVLKWRQELIICDM